MTHVEKNRDFTVLALCLSAWNDWPPTRHVYWRWYWGPLLKFLVTHAMMTYISMLPLFLWWLWLYKYARALSLAGLALFPLTEFSCLCNYEELWQVMLPWRCHASSGPWGRIFFHLCCCWFIMDDLFSTVLKNVKQQAVTVFDTRKWNSHQNLLAVIGFLWRFCEHEDYASLNEKIMG